MLNQTENLFITTDRDYVHIKIRKKYEPALYIFLLFAFSFIALVIMYLLPLAEEQKQDPDSKVLIIVETIFKVVGSFIFLAAVYEILRREFIDVTNKELIIGSSVLGFKLFEKRYILKRIKNLNPATPPKRGWQITGKYEDLFRKWTHYQNDNRKVFPAICFHYDGGKFEFADGLLPHEAENVIKLIKTHTDKGFY